METDREGENIAISENSTTGPLYFWLDDHQCSCVCYYLDVKLHKNVLYMEPVHYFAECIRFHCVSFYFVSLYFQFILFDFRCLVFFLYKSCCSLVFHGFVVVAVVSFVILLTYTVFVSRFLWSFLITGISLFI